MVLVQEIFKEEKNTRAVERERDKKRGEKGLYLEDRPSFLPFLRFSFFALLSSLPGKLFLVVRAPTKDTHTNVYTDINNSVS